jgi:hypothetical protein
MEWAEVAHTFITKRMENQNPPPFPFDGLDAPFDASDFSGIDQFVAPALSAQAPSSLQRIRTELLDLIRRLQTIVDGIDSDGNDIGAMHQSTDWRAEATSTSAPMIKMPPIDPSPTNLEEADAEAMRVIEGVFDGQNMVGPDGKQYSIPANYASKSKLVEGDILKLRITQRGAFVYKQIGPIPRERRIGILERDDLTGEYVIIVADHDADRSTLARAIADGDNLPAVPFKRYRTLRASISYYRGEPGDEVVVFVPKDTPSTWSAVDNIIKTRTR